MKRHFSLALAMSMCASVSFAGGLADPIIPAPVPAPAPIPLDFYVGWQAGILSGDVTPPSIDTANPAVDIEGPIYGVHAGVQRSFGSWMGGIELDYNTTNVDLEDSGTDAVVEMDTLAHLKLRAGTNAGPAFIYGTAGIAYTEMMIDPVAGAALNVSDTAPYFGIGTDVMINQSFSVGAEVLKHNFEDIDDSGYDVDFVTAMLRASFHF